MKEHEDRYVALVEKHTQKQKPRKALKTLDLDGQTKQNIDFLDWKNYIHKIKVDIKAGERHGRFGPPSFRDAVKVLFFRVSKLIFALFYCFVKKFVYSLYSHF